MLFRIVAYSGPCCIFRALLHWGRGIINYYILKFIIEVINYKWFIKPLVLVASCYLIVLCAHKIDLMLCNYRSNYL